MKEAIIVLLIVIATILIGILYDKSQRKKLNNYFGDTLSKTGHPLLRMYHNGKPYLLLLDTGATHNVIDSNRLNEFDKKFTRKKANIISCIGDVNTNENHEIYTIRFDDKLNSFTDDFVSLDITGICEDFEGEKVVGILGVSFLSKYALTLDFKNNIVS